jgi:hypothetical protein
VLKILDTSLFVYLSTFQIKWPILASKIDFVLPVRNCESTESGITSKSLPVFLQQQRFKTLSQQEKMMNASLKPDTVTISTILGNPN